MEAQIQLSRALIEAKTEKDNAVADAIAQATAEKLEGVQHNPDPGIIKVSVSCCRQDGEVEIIICIYNRWDNSKLSLVYLLGSGIVLCLSF